MIILFPSWFFLCNFFKYRCPRKRAHILRIFVEQMNRARRVKLSPHETATQKVFPPLVLFHCTLTWAPFAARTMSILYSNALKHCHTFEARFLPQNGRLVFSNLTNKWLMCGTPGPFYTPKGINPCTLNPVILQATQWAHLFQSILQEMLQSVICTQ
jgi:hypothetical protein